MKRLYMYSRTKLGIPTGFQYEIDGEKYIVDKNNDVIIDINDFTNPNERNGRNLYLYRVLSEGTGEREFVISLDSHCPSSFNVKDVQKLGGCHCFVEDIPPGFLRDKMILENRGYLSGDIIKESVFDTFWRPACDYPPEGMAYFDEMDKWVTIEPLYTEDIVER